MDRRVVVTAGASGIGLAIAKKFAAEGDRVFICDINEEGLRKVLDAESALSGAVCNVGDRAQVQAFIDQAAEELGGIDVLVNNAGISGPTENVEDMDLDAWESVLAVNLSGTYAATQRAIPHLKKADAGCIVTMSSVGGRFGYPGRSPYATTKRGLIALTETLALELGGDGVRANAIAPGAVGGDRIERVLQGRADQNGTSFEDEKAKALGNQALQQFVDADDIAELAFYLASDKAKSITGQTIAIDNGSKAAQ